LDDAVSEMEPGASDQQMEQVVWGGVCLAKTTPNEPFFRVGCKTTLGSDWTNLCVTTPMLGKVSKLKPRKMRITNELCSITSGKTALRATNLFCGDVIGTANGEAIQ